MFIRQALSDYWRGNSASLKNKVIILLLKNFVTDTGFLSHRCRRYPHLNLKTWTLETTLTNLQNGAKTVKKTQRIPNKNNSLDKTISDFRFHSNRGPKWILCFTITELWNCANTVVGSQKWYTLEFPFMPSRVTMLIYICSWHAWHPCPSSLFAEHLPCTHARRARDPCIKWGFWLVVHNLDCVQGFWLVVQKLDLVQFVSPVSWSEQKW